VSNSWGGLEINQFKSALYFKECGYSVAILGKKGSPIYLKCDSENLDFIALEEHSRYKYFFAGLKLKNVIESNSFTHLFVRTSTDLNICSIAKKFLKQKFKLAYFMEMQLGVSKRNFLHTARFKQIDAWFCSSEFLKKQVLQFTKFGEHKIHLSPSPIDLNYFQSYKINKEEARIKLGLPENKRIIGLAGRFDRNKGHDLLLHAFLESKTEKIELCFMGSKDAENLDYFEEIQEIIRLNKIEEKVHFISFQEDVRLFYKAIDLFIMASKSETFGMVTLEALASKTPVNGSNSGGTTEILAEGKAGSLFESSNKSDLREKIDEFFRNGSQISEEFLEKHLAKFDREQVIIRIEEILKINR
jgi:glycosyltransferase involved in cell wall biosynthesis